jgi:SAM-dependent methyltransferase
VEHPQEPRQHHERVEHHHEGNPAGEAGDAAMAELLDLDAEVLGSFLSEVTSWVAAMAVERPPQRILDLGCGTGTGSFALLERFDQAEATALDVSGDLLRRLTERARALGVAKRVRTLQVDLEGAWPHVGTVDLAWASSSLHHLADPDRVLTGVFAVLRPGGLLVVVEMDGFPRFLPDKLGVGRPGLEARCHEALEKGRATQLPHLDADWGQRLVKAGFAIERERRFVVDLVVADLAPPLPDAAGRYAELSLRRMRSNLDGQLSDEDLATLDLLTDPDGPYSIRQRSDLAVRSTRTAWAATRP